MNGLGVYSRRSVTVLSICLLFGVIGGCGKEAPPQQSTTITGPAPVADGSPPIATSASLILAQLKSQPCQTTQINDQTFPAIQVAGGPSLDQVKNLITWVNSNINNSPDYKFESSKITDTTDEVRTYTDVKDGTTVTTGTMLGQLGDNPFGRASIKFCSYYIDSVTILDTTTPMPKLAQITYTVNVTPSDTASRISAAASLGWSWSKDATPFASEQSMTLRKLDATGWRVEG